MTKDASRSRHRSSCAAALVNAGLILAAALLTPSEALASDPIDALPGDYSGTVTIGDSRDGAIIPGEFLLSIDLGLQLRRVDSTWSGEISFKRFVTTNATRISPPDCQNVAARELTAPLDTLTVLPDGTFQATSAPVFLCVRSNKAVARQLQLQGIFVTRNNCSHVELRGATFGDYQETVTGLITIPSGNQISLLGTYLLVKAKEPPGRGLPVEGDRCQDLNP